MITIILILSNVIAFAGGAFVMRRRALIYKARARDLLTTLEKQTNLDGSPVEYAQIEEYAQEREKANAQEHIPAHFDYHRLPDSERWQIASKRMAKGMPIEDDCKGMNPAYAKDIVAWRLEQERRDENG